MALTTHPICAEVKKRVEIDINSLSLPSWQVAGLTLSYL
jgi:hypothetical protein